MKSRRWCRWWQAPGGVGGPGGHCAAPCLMLAAMMLHHRPRISLRRFAMPERPELSRRPRGPSGRGELGPCYAITIAPELVDSEMPSVSSLDVGHASVPVARDRVPGPLFRLAGDGADDVIGLQPVAPALEAKGRRGLARRASGRAGVVHGPGVALYSSLLCRRFGDRAHTTASGFSCSRSLTSMLQKPSTALVGVPSGRVSVTGRAW